MLDFEIKDDGDPLMVLATTRAIAKNSRLVKIDEDNLRLFASTLKAAIEDSTLLDADQFGRLDQSAVRKIWWLDNINFCFWAEKDKPRLEVTLPDGTKKGGWRGLVAAFDRAIADNVPILDTDFLATGFILDQAKKVFMGENNVPIPLVEQRYDNLVQAAQILNNRYQGKIENMLASAQNNASTIAQRLIDEFPSFRDYVDTPEGRIFFLKRAQIFPYDLSLAGLSITGCNDLTVFADYRLPQLLREPQYHVLIYTNPLAQKVDNLELLSVGSAEEMAIRAATIWACELIAREIGKPPVVVDNAIWLMANRMGDAGMKYPHHRTYTQFY